MRFRAAIKEPEELVYLFLVIAIGLSMGAGQFTAGLTLTFFAVVAIIIHSKLGSKKDSNMQLFDVDVLTVNGPNEKTRLFDSYVEDNIPELKYEIASINAENGKFEAVYRIYTQATRVQRENLISWISDVSHEGVSVRLGRSVKIPQ